MKYIYTIIGLSALLTFKCYAQSNSRSEDNYKMQPIHIPSRWAKDVVPKNVLKEYPRPQFQRQNWQCLNGLWEYSITDSSISIPTTFDGKILVPYPIESALSGVQKRLTPDKILWYKKIISRPSVTYNEHVFLNFGAVDWQATIFINGRKAGQHSGGYQSFSVDITNFLKSGNNDILVKVYDPTDQGINPHGKQVLNPTNMYYTPSSGIWQTVWLEVVSSTHITRLKTTPDIDKGTLNLSVNTTGKMENTSLEVIATAMGKTVGVLKVNLNKNQENSVIAIPNARLWSPDDPFLYDLTVKLIKNNKSVDEIKSYFGMRKINIQKDEKGADRIFLNNKYTYNLGILDQGFWPEGIYTAPTDEALAFDIKAIKSLGFNTIRKHIKVEPDRWYYHADKIGVLVWQDFVNPPYNLPQGSKSIFEKEMQETMEQLYNHPSIVTWVLFNERWGSYDQERLTNWVKKHDPSRIVNGHSGELLYVDNVLREPSDKPWIGSDMTDVHSYPYPRNAPPQPNKARVVGEFGGVGVSVPGHEWDDTKGWGYIQVTPAKLKDQYTQMVQELKKLEIAGLSASIYTQPFDVEGEENGLLTYDREIIKIPLNDLRIINQELVHQTKGFALDSNFIVAADINVNDNDSRYDEMTNEYKNGRRDSVFLRRLTLMSIRKKDQEKATLFGNDFISLMTSPYSKENLIFIRKITKTSSDKGFELFRMHPEKVDLLLWDNSALSKVKSIIQEEEIPSIIDSNTNWEEIQQRVTNKYGEVGEEVVFGNRMIYYGVDANKKDWKNYAKYYVLYYKKALEHPLYHVNNMSWNVFEHVTDISVLEFAASVMKYSVEKWDQNNIEAYDTYANLLHKLNKSKEAIKWEEKALLLGKGTGYEKIFAETLQKMKAGLPTWPQTQNN